MTVVWLNVFQLCVKQTVLQGQCSVSFFDKSESIKKKEEEYFILTHPRVFKCVKQLIKLSDLPF